MGTLAVTRFGSIAITAAVTLALVVTACGESAPTATPSAQTGGVATPTAIATSPASTARGEGQTSGLGTPVVSVAATADFKFAPGSVSVKAGDVIQWSMVGPGPVEIFFEPGPSGEDNSALNSPELRQGDTWQVKIFAPGTYAYLNNLHGGMIGHVTVSS